MPYIKQRCLIKYKNRNEKILQTRKKIAIETNRIHLWTKLIASDKIIESSECDRFNFLNELFIHVSI